MPESLFVTPAESVDTKEWGERWALFFVRLAVCFGWGLYIMSKLKEIIWQAKTGAHSGCENFPRNPQKNLGL